MSSADLLGWIDRRELSGVLTMERGTTTRKLKLTAGCVTSASSTDLIEHLGQLLVSAGHLDEEALCRALAQQERSGLSLGKQLLMNGWVEEAALREALTTQIQEGTYDVLSWDDGSFVFSTERAEPPRAEVEVALPLSDLLLAGAERASRWREIRRLIPGDDARFWIPDRSWVERAKPGSASALLLADVDSGRSLREIILHRRALPFQVWDRLADLLKKGIIRIDRRATPRARPEGALGPEELLEAARGRLRGGDPVGALDLARRALDAAPADAPVKSEYERIERAIFAELSRPLLQKYRVPRLTRRREEIDRLELSPQERYVVGRVDGRWDLLSLLEVSAMRPLDTLVAFHRLAERGILSLE